MTQGTEVPVLPQLYIGNGEVPTFVGTPTLQTTILHHFLGRQNASGTCIDGDLSNARPQCRVRVPGTGISPEQRYCLVSAGIYSLRVVRLAKAKATHNNVGKAHLDRECRVGRCLEN